MEKKTIKFILTKVLLENGWNSKQMITEGEAAIPLETTLHAFRNQEKTKQRSTIMAVKLVKFNAIYEVDFPRCQIPAI